MVKMVLFCVRVTQLHDYEDWFVVVDGAPRKLHEDVFDSCTEEGTFPIQKSWPGTYAGEVVAPSHQNKANRGKSKKKKESKLQKQNF